MIVLDDGSVYLDKGETFPFKCPECGDYTPYVDNIAHIVCNKCGLIGTPEDFSDVRYNLERNQ